MSHDWHPLPMLIGTALNNRNAPMCGGFIARYMADGSVLIGERVDRVEKAHQAHGRVAEGKNLFTQYDGTTEEYLIYRKLGRINPPDGGWSLDEIDDDIFDRYR